MAVSTKQPIADDMMPGPYGWQQVPQRDLWHYARILWRRRWCAGIGLAVVLALTFAYVAFAPRVWGARAKLLVTGPSRTPLVSTAVSELATGISQSPFNFGSSNELSTQVAILNSRPIAEAAVLLMQRRPELLRSLNEGRKRGLTTADIRELMADPALKDPPAVEDLEARMLVSSLQVSPVESTNVVQIKASAATPEKAGEFVNAVCISYLIASLERTQRVASGCLEYVNDQLRDAEKKREAAEDKLVAYTARLKLGDPETGVRLQVEQYAELKGQVGKLKGEVAQKQAQLSECNRQLSRQERVVVQQWTETKNPVVSTLEEKLVELNLQRSSLLNTYTETSSKVRALDADIAATKAAIGRQTSRVSDATTRAVNPLRAQLLASAATLRVELRSAQAALAQAEGMLSKQDAQVAKMPREQQNYARLRAEVELTESQYRILRQKQAEYALAKESQVSGSELLEPATLRERQKVSPRTLMSLLAGCMFGGFLGILLALVAEARDDRYLDAAEVEYDLGLPLLGSIPALASTGVEVKAGQEDALVREAFLSLHATLGFSGPVDRPLTLLVTCGMRGEGATTVASGLALAAAQAGERVALVDANLRSPAVSKRMGLAAAPGLVEMVTGQASLAECLQERTLPGGGMLSVLPAGTPEVVTPQALLESQAFQEVLKKLQAQADCVVIDAPPPGEFSDALILSRKCSAVLLVFDETRARRPALRSVRTVLARAGANVLGLVANRSGAQ